MAFRPDIIAGRAVIIVSLQDKLNQELRRIRSTIRRFSNSMAELGGDLFRFGAVGTLGALIPTRAFMEFQDQMLFMQTKLQATDDTMKDLEKTILQLGRTTSFTSTEVALAGTELAKADFSAQQIQRSLQAVLDLGRGAQIPLGEAAKLLVNTLQTFKLPAEEAARVASAFVSAARNGTIDVIELKESIKELAGTFRFLNIPLDETLATITALSFSSLKGTKAGTSLNTMFLNMARHAKKLNEELGVQPFKNGTFVGVVPFLNQMEKALDKLPEEQQLAKVANIFNIRGGRAQAALFLRGLDKIKETINDIKSSSDEARASALKLDSKLGGFFRRALSSFQNLNIAIGRTAEGPLSKFLDIARKVFITLESLSGVNPQFFQTLLIIPPIALAAGAALLTMSLIFSKIAMLLTPIISLTGLFFSGLVRGGVANAKLVKVLATMKGFKTLAFSGSGIFLLLEGLLLFGQRMPVLGSLFRIISAAFTGLGRNLALMLPGLKEAFGIMSDGFNDTDVERGFVRLKSGFEEVGIAIREGLKKAWDDFWADFEPITGRLMAFLKGVLNVIDSIIGSIDKVAESISKLLFGESTALLEGGIAGLLSSSRIEGFFGRIGDNITDIGDKISAVVDHITSVFTKAEQIVQAYRDITGQSSIFGETGVGTALASDTSRQTSENARIKLLREQMQAQAAEQDIRKKTLEIHKEMARKFNTLNRARGKEVIGGAQAELAPIAQAISASLVGSFAGTRGAKLALVETMEEKQLVALEQIEVNTRDGGSF